MTAGSSEEQLLEFLYACPVGLIECDAAGEIGMMNPHAMQHLLPLAGARDAGNLFTALDQHAPELRNMVAAFGPAIGRICEGHRIFVDLGSGRQNAVPKVLACTLVKLGPNRLMVTLSDISQQVVQEQRLSQANTWFATLLDGINDYATLTITDDGQIVSADACFTSQTGYDSVGAIGRPLAEILGEDRLGVDPRLSDQLAIALRDGWYFQEGWQRRANGDRYWCQRLIVAGAEMGTGTLSGFTVVLRDVPRRAAPTDDLRRLLTCDHLTGAANRRYFGQVLDRERNHWRDLRQPLSLIVLDLDHFKAVNDTHGHPTGDELLRRVSNACAAMLPPRCVFARLGGEEFGALLPRHDIAEAMLLAEALREEIARLEFVTPGGMLKITASFGCATLDEVDGSIDALIELADKRLYAAKREGRKPGASSPDAGGVNAPVLTGAAAHRIACAVVVAEVRRLRQADWPRGGMTDWPYETAIGDDGLGLDSLERLGALASLAEVFGLDDSLLDTAPPQFVRDWVDWIMLGHGPGQGYLTIRTSGSTGTPRACVHALLDLLGEAAFLAEQLADRRRVVALVPAHHLYGLVWTALLPAALDVPVVVRTVGAKLDLQAGDLVVAVPEQWQAILRLNRRMPDDIAGVSSAGSLSEAVGTGLLAAGLARMIDVYGSSETSAIALRDLPAATYDLLPRWRLIADGHDDWQLVDQSGQTVALPDHVVRTGDRSLRPISRRDGAVQVAGHNVWPERVAQALRETEGVTEAAVRLGAGGRLKAFIVPQEDVDAATLHLTLEHFVVARLTEPERPKSFRFGTSLPRNMMGKLEDWA